MRVTESLESRLGETIGCTLLELPNAQIVGRSCMSEIE